MIRTAGNVDKETLLAHDHHISAQELDTLIQLGRVYVLEEDGSFAGWLRYNLFWDNTPFMNMLYLLEGHRGKGLGKRLTQYWEADMKALGYDMVMTSTASDEYAQHFYNKLGYSTVGGFMPGDGGYEIILSKRV